MYIHVCISAKDGTPNYLGESHSTPVRAPKKVWGTFCDSHQAISLAPFAVHLPHSSSFRDRGPGFPPVDWPVLSGVEEMAKHISGVAWPRPSISERPLLFLLSRSVSLLRFRHSPVLIQEAQPVQSHRLS